MFERWFCYIWLGRQKRLEVRVMLLKIWSLSDGYLYRSSLCRSWGWYESGSDSSVPSKTMPVYALHKTIELMNYAEESGLDWTCGEIENSSIVLSSERVLSPPTDNRPLIFQWVAASRAPVDSSWTASIACKSGSSFQSSVFTYTCTWAWPRICRSKHTRTCSSLFC